MCVNKSWKPKAAVLDGFFGQGFAWFVVGKFGTDRDTVDGLFKFSELAHGTVSDWILLRNKYKRVLFLWQFEINDAESGVSPELLYISWCWKTYIPDWVGRLYNRYAVGLNLYISKK